VVAFFEGFIVIIKRGFDLLFEGDFRLAIFEFIFSVFNEGRERAGVTHIYLLCLLLLHISLCPLLVLAPNAGMWQASGHLDGAGAKVNLGIVFFKPAESEDHALLP